MTTKTRSVYSSGRFITAILLFAALHTAKADFIGVYAGAGSWYHSATGKVDHLGTPADLEQDLGFDKNWSGFFYLAVEHPVPLIPNVRLSQ